MSKGSDKKFLTRHDHGTEQPWVDPCRPENKEFRGEMAKGNEICEQGHVVYPGEIALLCENAEICPD